MNAPKIIPKRIGYSNSSLILHGTNSILVDTGVSGHIHQFEKLFRRYNLKPDDIKLIILTHIHYDHAGNLHDLVKLTGAKVLVHRNEYEKLKNGFIHIPTGQGIYTHFITTLGKKLLPKFASPKPFKADLINDDEYDLSDFGLQAKVISTPGHSSGSQSVLMGDKLISGDAFLNLKYGVIFPHFAEDPKLLLQTWQKLYNLGVQEIYPGHGPKLQIEKTYPVFEKRKKKLKVELNSTLL